MKKIFLFLVLTLAVCVSFAKTTNLMVDASPQDNGLLRFLSADNYYFTMDSCDFSRSYDVYDTAGTRVGSVKADPTLFTGFSGSMAVGYFVWTVKTPGNYVLDIPENSFIFHDYEQNVIGNAALRANITVLDRNEIHVRTTLKKSEVTYIDDFEGMDLVFDGATTVEVGNYAALGIYKNSGQSYYVGGWVSSQGTYSVSGNTVYLNGFEKSETGELGEVKIVLSGCQYVKYGLHGWIIDGQDVESDFVFYLAEEESSIAGHPVFKAVKGTSYDLKGCPVESQKGLQIRDGKSVFVK